MNNPKTRAITALLLCATLLSCGGGSGGGGSSAAPVILRVVVADGDYSDVLIDCVQAESASQSCALETLPVLGQQISNPSVDDILNRTVVSHDWMAVRFRQVLESMPAELLGLFKATTAAVIAADIRPSNYTTLTGAIYLDPAGLWLTNAEKATISRDPDFRADFGRELNFVSLTRYLDGTDYAWDYFPLNGTETRTLSDIIRPMAALLFHELAHANDFIPPSRVASLDSSMSFIEAIRVLESFRISTQLTGSSALNSQVWLDLAEVLYLGRDPDADERALTAEQVGIEFETDGANDDYAYTSQYEDVAMLFEEVMLKHFFDIDHEVAYTDVPPEGEEQYCDSYIIRWGYRSRGNETLVRSRAELALQLLLDQSDVSHYLDSLATPTRLANGFDWCTIQSVNGAPAQAIGVPDQTPGPRKTLRPDDQFRWHR